MDYWTYIYLGCNFASFVTTSIMSKKTYFYVTPSSNAIRVVLFFLFLSYSGAFMFRTLNNIISLTLPKRYLQNDLQGIDHRLSSLGLPRQVITEKNLQLPTWLTCLFVIQNAFMSIGMIWLVIFSYEIRRLQIRNMDIFGYYRNEKKQKNIYCYGVLSFGSLYIITFCKFAFHPKFGNIGQLFFIIFMIEGIVHLVIIFYMIITVIHLIRPKKVRKDFSLNHSTSDSSRNQPTPSPVPSDIGCDVTLFRRLRNLLCVYLIFAAPIILLDFYNTAKKYQIKLPSFIFGICISLFSSLGIGLYITMNFSQRCCLKLLPYNVRREFCKELQLTVDDQVDNNFHINYGSQIPLSVDPPLNRPVFVCTDIEGSSDLWNTLEIPMAKAQKLHDDLLRYQLVFHNGYEIATCGDAFYLAFHNTIDAVEYCVTIQTKLLNLSWPSELDNFSKSKIVMSNSNDSLNYDIIKKKKKKKRKLIDHIPLFCKKNRTHENNSKKTHKYNVKENNNNILYRGIRIRMGIHIGDSKLVYKYHKVTYKLTYCGPSEIIAREVGDAGTGGQILITKDAFDDYLVNVQESNNRSSYNNNNKRVKIKYADNNLLAVQANTMRFEIPYEIEPYGNFHFYNIKRDLFLYQIVPVSLKERKNMVTTKQLRSCIFKQNDINNNIISTKSQEGINIHIIKTFHESENDHFYSITSPLSISSVESYEINRLMTFKRDENDQENNENSIDVNNDNDDYYYMYERLPNELLQRKKYFHSLQMESPQINNILDSSGYSHNINNIYRNFHNDYYESSGASIRSNEFNESNEIISHNNEDNDIIDNITLDNCNLSPISNDSPEKMRNELYDIVLEAQKYRLSPEADTGISKPNIVRHLHSNNSCRTMERYLDKKMNTPKCNYFNLQTP